MNSTLYERTLYLNKDIDYLFNCEIREYDMHRAGLSLLKEFKLVDTATLSRLEGLEKEVCNKEIGMLQRNVQGLAQAMNESFVLARKMFFEANNIEDQDVLAIKKDAIFILKKLCEHTTFGNINFRVKNQYLGYLYINKTEFYYKDPDTDLEVKGLGDEAPKLHKDYMLDFIKDLFTMALHSDRKRVIYFLTDFIKAYRHNELDYNYYRELNESSFFKIKTDDEIIAMQNMDNAENPNLDITYNYFMYLVPIATIFI